jgi:RNA polymerase sigma factor (TIGR02999 family)
MARSDLRASFEAHYVQVLDLAHLRLRRERSPISTYTLAHDLWLQLQGRDDLQFDTREQFLAYASRALRSLLVDMARERIAKKRHAELLPLTLGEEVADLAGGTPEQMLALNQAIERLGQLEPRLLQVADMRAIMGMELAAIADVLGLSESAIKRDWQRAKAFIIDLLEPAS